MLCKWNINKIEVEIEIRCLADMQAFHAGARCCSKHVKCGNSGIFLSEVGSDFVQVVERFMCCENISVASLAFGFIRCFPVYLTQFWSWFAFVFVPLFQFTSVVNSVGDI
jgi:hypothetical protein